MVMVYHPCPIGRHEVRRSGRKTTLALTIALAVPLTAGLGYSVDTVRGFAVQARLSKAVDAAALAGGRVMFDDQRDGHIRTFFEDAFPKGFLGTAPPSLAIADDPRSGTLTVSGRTTVQAVFLRLVGKGDLTVEAHSVVRRGSSGRKGT